MNLNENQLLAAIWVAAGVIYIAFVALTGERGVAGVVGLVIFILVIIASPRIVDLLKGSLDES